MNEGKIPEINKENREWSVKLSNEAVALIKNLENKDQAVIVDCGAGEGRHSAYALEQGIGKVIAIERDSAQNKILKAKKEQNINLELRSGNTLDELKTLDDESIDGIIDCGMSHYFQTEEDRARFAELVKQKLKKEGLYSITHFSEHETAANDKLHKATLDELKSLFPSVDWDDSVMPWREESWESGGNKHFAYKAVLKKK